MEGEEVGEEEEEEEEVAHLPAVGSPAAAQER
jgi:hypothetical protein